MRVLSGAQNDPYGNIQPAFQRLAGVRAVELQSDPPKDPLTPSLRVQTLVDLGSVYRGPQ